jgi:UMF1 family MFS transporter
MSSEPTSPSVSRGPLLERLALHRPELRAWALYDWANSAIFTVVITAVFPYFFAAVPGADLTGAAVRERFTLTTTIAMAIAAVLGPILGAVADYGRLKKRLFTVFLLLGVLAVASMVLLRRGDWLAASILFGLANVGIASSLVFYDAFLPHVARPDEADRLSTTGYAVGYLGGGIALAVVVGMILWQEPLGIAGEDGLSARLGFLFVAVWWLAFTIPFLRRVREPERATLSDEHPGMNPVRVAFVRIGETVRELSTYRQAFLMLIAFLVYSDGIGTIVRMAVLFASELEIPQTTTILCILLVQFIGIPFAILFGRLAGRIGAKRSILVALSGYIVLCVWASQVETAAGFVAMAVMVGMVQGGAQALSRSLFSSLVPKHKSGEFFGLFSTLEKFAGILGPLVFFLAPSSRAAVLWVILFFVVGAGLLLFVDVEAGRKTAEDVEARRVQGRFRS